MAKYCMECGAPLKEKFLEDEGMVPFCESCSQYRFPMYNVAVSMIVRDDITKDILLIQQYGRPFYILVAGYVSLGEALENACVRELKEETGMDAVKVSFNHTKYFERSNTLMCNFTVWIHDKNTISPNKEIDSYHWFTEDEAKKSIKEGSLAKEFLDLYLQNQSYKEELEYKLWRSISEQKNQDFENLITTDTQISVNGFTMSGYDFLSSIGEIHIAGFEIESIAKIVEEQYITQSTYRITLVPKDENEETFRGSLMVTSTWKNGRLVLLVMCPSAI